MQVFWLAVTCLVGRVLLNAGRQQAGGAGWLTSHGVVDRAAAGRRGWLDGPTASVIASRIRAQRAYPAGFALDIVGSLLVGLTEFGELFVIFHNIEVLGGLDFDAMLLLFGLSNLSWSIADMVVGHVDTLPTYVRAGTLDAFFLRPQPVLGAADHQRVLAAAARAAVASGS